MTDRPSLVSLIRQDNRFAIRDEAAGYFRYLEDWEVARLLEQAASLNYAHVICRGKIPVRE